MSETKHTPGPWAVGPTAGGIVAPCPKADPESCHACDNGAAKFYGGHLICESVGGPDAVLIAAAPDLLAALEKAERNLREAADLMLDYADIEATLSCAKDAADALAKVKP